MVLENRSSNQLEHKDLFEHSGDSVEIPERMISRYKTILALK